MMLSIIIVGSWEVEPELAICCAVAVFLLLIVPITIRYMDEVLRCKVDQFFIGLMAAIAVITATLVSAKSLSFGDIQSLIFLNIAYLYGFYHWSLRDFELTLRDPIKIEDPNEKQGIHPSWVLALFFWGVALAFADDKDKNE